MQHEKGAGEKNIFIEMIAGIYRPGTSLRHCMRPAGPRGNRPATGFAGWRPIGGGEAHFSQKWVMIAFVPRRIPVAAFQNNLNQGTTTPSALSKVTQ
jgi:hypothetical protein